MNSGGIKAAQLIKKGEAFLSGHSVPNSRHNAEWMLAYLDGCSRAELYLDTAKTIDQATAAAFDALLRRRAVREPLQYILGRTEFMALDFFTCPGVVIPRFETERLVEIAEMMINKTPQPQRIEILDMCCGSGIIAISIAARNHNIFATGIDISHKAVRLSVKNAALNGVSGRTNYFVDDGISFLKKTEKIFHAIICNPPYITTADMNLLAPEIKNHEPAAGLDGGSDGLDFYRGAASSLPRCLVPGGIAAFEVGTDQGDAVAVMLGEEGFSDICIHKDYNRHDRVVTALSKSRPLSEETAG